MHFADRSEFVFGKRRSWPAIIHFARIGHMFAACSNGTTGMPRKPLGSERINRLAVRPAAVRLAVGLQALRAPRLAVLDSLEPV
jgi:hypothetical protein